jgi:hypothetical protein
MIQISQLTKEQRVKEICQDIDNKSINSLSFSPTQTIIDPSTLTQIIESIEDRIYFISESPSFEFEGRRYTCPNYKCDKIEDFKSLMDNNSDSFFIIYNITDISFNPVSSYIIRGVFLEDPLIKREKIINQILDEK